MDPFSEDPAAPRRWLALVAVLAAGVLVHGVLHAQGWAHERAREARAMQARESALLGALGFADPYARR